jgi:hypothetical protein
VENKAWRGFSPEIWATSWSSSPAEHRLCRQITGVPVIPQTFNRPRRLRDGPVNPQSHHPRSSRPSRQWSTAAAHSSLTLNLSPSSLDFSLFSATWWFSEHSSRHQNSARSQGESLVAFMEFGATTPVCPPLTDLPPPKLSLHGRLPQRARMHRLIRGPIRLLVAWARVSGVFFFKV